MFIAYKENSMPNLTRVTSLVAGSLAIATLAACSSYGPTYGTAPTYTTYPTASAYPVAGTEFGRIVNIEYMPVGTRAPAGNALGAVIGGVAGGLLGNQVGKGHGREAATAAGAVIGAITGDRLANQGPQAYEQTQREVRSCRTVYDQQQQLTGYRVTYEYHGRQYVTVMREQPGNSVPVRVSVTPVEEREQRRTY
jgi:uncharacterized protein YcfJ